MGNLVLALAVALLYWWSVRREPRRLRLGVYLVTVPWLLLAAAANLGAAALPQHNHWPMLVLAPLPLSVLALAGLVIVDSLTVLRTGGRNLRHLRTLLLGLALLALPVIGTLLAETAQTAQTAQTLLIGLAAVAFLVSFYLGVAFLSFLAYALSYGRARARSDPSAVVVLGSNLVHGRVPPLLEGRLERGIGEWQHQVALGHRPLLVPTGGPGADRHRSEGAAMADYLVEHGIPATEIVAETEARTTQENLALSQQVVIARGRQGHLTVVTSSYHVARTSLLTRREGLDADVLGSHTDGYAVRRALLREFLTVLTFYPRLHAVLLLPSLALAVLLARAI
ncbi:MAG: YdcF family protein [Humibacillus sp.]|nr:YdcF family protein [Humibacillus sp.]MDN5777723.1 YdcF family protein [Humibacillus sp.]